MSPEIEHATRVRPSGRPRCPVRRGRIDRLRTLAGAARFAFGQRGRSGTRTIAACALGLALLGGCAKTSDGPPEVVFGLDEHWPDRTQYPGVGDGRVLVTNNYEDTISLFDLATIGDPAARELLRSPVGLSAVELEGPHHAAIDPGGEYFYIGISNYLPVGGGSGPHGKHGNGTGDGYALKYRSSDNRLVGTARVDPNPGDIVTTPDGSTLLVTHYDLKKMYDAAQRQAPAEANSRLAIIEAATMKRTAMIDLCPAAHGVRLSPDGRTAYVACYTDEIAFVRLDDPTHPVTRVKVAPDAGGITDAGYTPYAVTVSPTSGEVWVSALKVPTLFLFDPATSAMDGSRAVTLDGTPIFGEFTRDGGTMYVAHQRPDGVAIVDPATSRILSDLRFQPDVCTNAHQIHLTPDERYGLLVCEGDHVRPGTLVVLDLASAGDYVAHHVLGVFPDFVGVMRRQP